MVDMAMIQGAVMALKTAQDTAKAIIGVHDAAVIRQKVVELQTQILAAQSSALAAQSDQFTLLERVRELEKEIADLKAWDAEKRKYELKAVAPKTFAYVLKPGESGTEPPHWLCAACYQDSKKAILNLSAHAGAESIWTCPVCKSAIRVSANHFPAKPWQMPAS